MDRITQRLVEKAEQAQRELTPEQNEDLIWKWYNTAWGFVQSAPDLYARVSITECIDNLLATALLTIPSYSKERAETADAKTTSPLKPGAASTASYTTPSGKSPVVTSPDPSFSHEDEDTGHR